MPGISREIVTCELGSACDRRVKIEVLKIKNFAHIGHTALKMAPCERARLELLYLGGLGSVEI